MTAGPSKAKSPRIENSIIKNLRSSLEEEIISEIKGLLFESQREPIKVLKPKTGENCDGEI